MQDAPHRITLLVLAYQQAPYIGDAVRSALAQACEPIEIILSDDASGDDTFAQMQALAAGYQGPHRIVLNRNEQNLGIGQHYNRLIELAQGELLVTQAGDDISLPHRVARIAQTWDAEQQKPDLIASHLLDLDDQGRTHQPIRVDELQDWISLADWVRHRPHVIGAAQAFTKRLHRRFGPYTPGLTYEDQVNVLRAIAAGGARTIDEPLVLYRRGGLSSGRRHAGKDAFRVWSQRRNSAHLALHAQWLADAAALHQVPAVEGGIRFEHMRERYLQAQLQSRTLRERWQCAMAWPRLPLEWRLRKAVHLAWPWLVNIKR